MTLVVTGDLHSFAITQTNPLRNFRLAPQIRADLDLAQTRPQLREASPPINKLLNRIVAIQDGMPEPTISVDPSNTEINKHGSARLRPVPSIADEPSQPLLINIEGEKVLLPERREIEIAQAIGGGAISLARDLPLQSALEMEAVQLAADSGIPFRVDLRNPRSDARTRVPAVPDKADAVFRIVVGNAPVSVPPHSCVIPVCLVVEDQIQRDFAVVEKASAFRDPIHGGFRGSAEAKQLLELSSQETRRHVAELEGAALTREWSEVGLA